MVFFETIRRQPKWLALIEGLFLIGLFGWFDHVTDWEWSFFAAYALPIMLVVWRTDWLLGFLFATLCTVAYWLADVDSNPYRTHWGFLLGVLSRWLYFMVLVVAVAAVKAQRDVDRQRIANLERAQELELQILRTSDQERQRIGHDLHDNLGPHLAAIGYAASFLGKQLRAQNGSLAVEAEKIREMAQDAVALAQNIARGISPVPMAGEGLSIALEELARTTSEFTGLAVSFEETGEIQAVDEESALHLYRIAQEAVNNAVKHSGAAQIAIALSTNAAGLSLTVADDGQGTPPAGPVTRGIGWHSMKYRARVLGGHLKIHSRPGQGTSVSCLIPSLVPETVTLSA